MISADHRVLGVALLLLLLTACSSSPAGRRDAGQDAAPRDASTARDAGSDLAIADVATDAPILDAGQDVVIGSDVVLDAGRDSGPDAATMDAGSDGPATDAPAVTCMVPGCAATPGPERARCEGAVPLEPGAPLTMQDAALGGYGDCAVSASGVGGKSLYYLVTIPAGRTARVAAAPASSLEPALVRALPDCNSSAVEDSERGGMSTQGRAGVCLTNDTDADRRVVFAVSQYSGEAMCLPLQFDVSVELYDQPFDCPFTT